MIVEGFLRTFFDRFVRVGGYAEMTVRPWNVAVVEGDVSGATALILTSKSKDGVVGGPYPIWEPDVSYTWQTSDQQPWVVSSDADDDGAPAGNGAQTVRVTWLNSAGAEATEDVTLNGVVNVQMAATTVRRINRVEVLAVGSTGYNEGDITVYASDAATIMAHMPSYTGISQTSIQSVPAGKRDVITHISGGCDTESASSCEHVRVFARTSTAEAFLPRVGLHGRCFLYEHDTPTPVVLEAGTDYYLQCDGITSRYRVVATGWRETA